MKTLDPYGDNDGFVPIRSALEEGVSAGGTLPTSQAIPGLLIPTVEGGLMCHQEISREAARRGVDCPTVVSVSLPARAGDQIAQWIRAGQYEPVVDVTLAAIERLRLAGATFAVITANLLHMVFEGVRARSPLPLISIVDVVAAYAAQRGFDRVGLLGTQPIMESDLYPKALAQSQIQVIVPNQAGRVLVNRIIFAELLAGIVTPDNRAQMARVARDLHAQGAQAVALCCTELGMVLDDQPDFPTLDSTKLLAHAVLDRSLVQP